MIDGEECMSYFKLNISNLENSINQSKNSIKLLEEDINTTYNNLSNVDSAWNDVNGQSFKEVIKKDKYETNEYLDNLKELLYVLEEFKNNLLRICLKVSENDKVSLYFNNDILNKIETKINNIFTNLTNINKYLNILENTDFSRKIIYNLKNEIKQIKADCLIIHENIKTFSLSVEKELDNTKEKIKKVSQKCIYNVEILQFNWQVEDITINNVKNIKQDFEIDNISKMF